MGNVGMGILDAVALAKDAEQKASAVYGDAAKEASNPLVRRLFEQLASFERRHYEKLVELEQSLRDKGEFIDYEGEGEWSTTPVAEGKRIDGAKKTSAVAVLKQAMQIELEAEDRYSALAKQTSDRRGRSMFEQLAKEEHTHYLVLQNAYYDLSNLKPLA